MPDGDVGVVGHSIPKSYHPATAILEVRGWVTDRGAAGGSPRNRFEIIEPLHGLAPWRSSDRSCKTSLRHSERGKFTNAIKGRTEEENSECPLILLTYSAGFDSAILAFARGKR